MRIKGNSPVNNWYSDVKDIVGREPFTFRDLPEKLQSKSMVMKAHSRGLLKRSGCTLPGKMGRGVYEWRAIA